MARSPRVPPSLAVTPFRGTEAIAAGLLTRRQLAGRIWLRLYRDVYVHAEVALDHRVWCEAVALLLPKSGAIAGLSALWMWGVAPLGEPDRVTVVLPEETRLRRHSRLEVRRGAVSPDDVTGILGLRVTTPERTAFDLARCLSRVDAIVCLDAMLKKGKVRLDRLVADFASRHRWPGRRRAEAALRFHADDVLRRPEHVVAQIRAVLLRRGSTTGTPAT